MKNKIIFLFVILFSLFFISNVSATLVSDAAWDDNSNTRTITFGEDAIFYVNSFTDEPPLFIDINIYSGNNLVSEYFNEIFNGGRYDREFTITSNDYRNSGVYRVHIEIQNREESDEFDLNLIVQNNAPEIELSSPQNGAEDIPLSVILIWRGSDPDDHELNYDVYLNNILRVSNTRSTSYRLENLQYNTQYNWYVVASDGDLETRSETWSFRTIERVNNAPEVNVVYPNGGEILSGAIIIQWRATDIDNDQLSIDIEYSDNSGRNWHALHNNLNNDGSEPWNTENYQNGDQYLIRVSASDGELVTSDVSDNLFSIRNDGNNRPVAFIDSPEDNHRANLGEVIQFRGHGEDADNDRITAYEWNFGNGVVSNEQNIDYVYSQAGEYDVEFKVKDEHGAWSNPDNVHVIITELNQEPVIDIREPGEGAIIGGAYNIRWNSYDVDGEIVNTKIYYKKHGLISDFLFWLNNYKLLVELSDNPQEYNWDTTRFPNGVYSLKIIVTDDDNAEGQDIVERFRIKNIFEINHAPKIISEPVTEVLVSTQYIYDVEAIDPDNDKITYRLGNAPEGMIINSNTGVINWLPQEIGIYEDVAVIASDGELSDLQIFTINVLPRGKIVPLKPMEVHKFSISNIILDQDNEYISVYVQIRNKGNQDERVELRAVNMENGDITFDSFLLEDNDNYWRILKLPKPSSGIYTIGVWGNSKDYKDMLYREIIIQ